MEINVLTLFPEIITSSLNCSIIGRAIKKELVNLKTTNIRDFADNKYKQVDDLPYGGGPGMIMKPEPVYKAVKKVYKPGSKVILMTPSGKKFNQKVARTLKNETNLIFICGHYEGIDERVNEIFNPLTLSIGNYVLTNGALAACVVIDAVVRLLPNVLGNEDSLKSESFLNGEMCEYPQYTRPKTFNGYNVPDVLLSGNHKNIEKWRKDKAEQKTIEIKDINNNV